VIHKDEKKKNKKKDMQIKDGVKEEIWKGDE